MQNPYKSPEPRYYLVIENKAKDKYIIRDRHTSEQFECRLAKETDVIHFRIKDINLTKIEK